MTVAELIAKLQEMPQEARVVTESTEEGYELIKDLFVVSIQKNTSGGYIGSYEDAEDGLGEAAVFVSWAS